MRIEFFACLLLVLASVAMRSATANAASGNPADITLGESTLALEGPWKFYTGDDSRWSPRISTMNVDFKAPPGAADGDVGLPDHVPGWAAKGHPGYVGFAWYRIRLKVTAPADKALAILGPLAVDSAYHKLDWPAWLPRAIAGLTLVLMVAHLLAHPWLFHDAYPQAVGKGMRSVITGVRWAFLLTYVFLIYWSIRLRGREGWYALPAMLTIGVVLFSSELAAMHVTGIWFPWGVGVSLSEYASVAFDTFLFVLLVRRLRSFVRSNRHGLGSPIIVG